MSRTIDAQSQTAGNHKTATRQAASKALRGIQPWPRCTPTADHGQLRLLQQRRVTCNKQQWRCIRQLSQQTWINCVIPHQQVVQIGVQPGQAVSGTFTHLGTTPCITAYLRQAQGTPGTSRRAERGRSTVEGPEEFTKATWPKLRQAVQAQTRFQFSGRNRRGNSRRLRHPDHP